MFSYFNSNDESGVLDSEGGNRGGGNSRPTLRLPTVEDEKRLAELEAAVTTGDAQLVAATQSLPALQTAWEEAFRKQLNDKVEAWAPLPEPAVKSMGGATFSRQEDGSWLAGGTNAPNDTYEIEAKVAPGLFTGVLLEVVPDPSLPNESLGRGFNGNFILSGIEAEINVPGAGEPLVAEFHRAQADYDQAGWEVGLIVREAEARWPVHIAVRHRLGSLEIGDIAVAVVAVSAHRAAAFEACRYVTEEVKRRVPIWKKEFYADGSIGWVDPTAIGRTGQSSERPDAAALGQVSE